MQLSHRHALTAAATAVLYNNNNSKVFHMQQQQQQVLGRAHCTMPSRRPSCRCIGLAAAAMQAVW
jgi:hypothetical protein